jgi:hypothetical protein
MIIKSVCIEFFIIAFVFTFAEVVAQDLNVTTSANTSSATHSPENNITSFGNRTQTGDKPFPLWIFFVMFFVILGSGLIFGLICWPSKSSASTELGKGSQNSPNDNLSGIEQNSDSLQSFKHLPITQSSEHRDSYSHNFELKKKTNGSEIEPKKSDSLKSMSSAKSKLESQQNPQTGKTTRSVVDRQLTNRSNISSKSLNGKTGTQSSKVSSRKKS